MPFFRRAYLVQQPRSPSTLQQEGYAKWRRVGHARWWCPIWPRRQELGLSASHAADILGELKGELCTQHLWSPYPKRQRCHPCPIKGDGDAILVLGGWWFNKHMGAVYSLESEPVHLTPRSRTCYDLSPLETDCSSSCPLSNTSGLIFTRHPVSAQHMLFNPTAGSTKCPRFLAWSPTNFSDSMELIQATTATKPPKPTARTRFTHFSEKPRTDLLIPWS